MLVSILEWHARQLHSVLTLYIPLVEVSEAVRLWYHGLAENTIIETSKLPLFCLPFREILILCRLCELTALRSRQVRTFGEATCKH